MERIQSDTLSRIEALSPEKQRLLALRLGIDLQSASTTDVHKHTLAAFVTAGGTVDEETLKQHLKSRLPHYMLPSQITILDELPRTPNGKVDRLALEKQAQNGASPALIEFTEPRTDTETKLVGIWSTVLGIEAISVFDDFFMIGGDSLQAARIVAMIQKTFDVPLRVTTMFQATTIAALATILDAETAIEEAPPTAGATRSDLIMTLRAGDPEKTPLFLVHGLGGEALEYVPLVRHLPDDQPVYGILADTMEKNTELETLENLATSYIQALKTVCPDGPYQLAGYSFGGTVAYEIGRQLRLAGEPVNLIALFEPYLPYSPSTLLENLQFRWKRVTYTVRHNLYWLQKIRPRDYFGYVRHRWTARQERLKTYDAFDLLLQLETSQIKQVKIADVPEMIEGNLQLFTYMIHKYRPQRYPGDVVLFASDTVFGLMLKKAVLHLIDGHLDHQAFSGYHETMLEEANVPILADFLKNHL